MTFFSFDATITPWALFHLSTNRFWNILLLLNKFYRETSKGTLGKKHSSAAWVPTLTYVRWFMAVNRKTRAVILFCTLSASMSVSFRSACNHYRSIHLTYIRIQMRWSCCELRYHGRFTSLRQETTTMTDLESRVTHGRCAWMGGNRSGKKRRRTKRKSICFFMVLLCFPIPGSGPGSTSSLRYTSQVRARYALCAVMRQRVVVVVVSSDIFRAIDARLHAAVAIVKNNIITDTASSHYHCRCWPVPWSLTTVVIGIYYTLSVQCT